MSVKVSQGFAKIFVLKCIDAVENKDIMIKSYFLSKSEDKLNIKKLEWYKNKPKKITKVWGKLLLKLFFVSSLI